MSWSAHEAKATRKAHRDAGLCIYCSRYAEIGQVCGEHWFVRLSQRLLGAATTANGTLLKATFVASKARCAYTGVELTFQTAAAVHRIPVSRGGARTAENVEWVTTAIGAMKGDMLPDEFVSLCKRIATHRSDIHG